mmetsp:Transcript_55361/g.98552  ORF Transcript_55361/g.98552 Transcript_55361/m.98552 type:complete len:161 (-) Transcript_55361:111-593(-)
MNASNKPYHSCRGEWYPWLYVFGIWQTMHTRKSPYIRGPQVNQRTPKGFSLKAITGNVSSQNMYKWQWPETELGHDEQRVSPSSTRKAFRRKIVAMCHVTQQRHASKVRAFPVASESIPKKANTSTWAPLTSSQCLQRSELGSGPPGSPEQRSIQSPRPL